MVGNPSFMGLKLCEHRVRYKLGRKFWSGQIGFESKQKCLKLTLLAMSKCYKFLRRRLTWWRRMRATSQRWTGSKELVDLVQNHELCKMENEERKFSIEDTKLETDLQWRTGTVHPWLFTAMIISHRLIFSAKNLLHSHLKVIFKINIVLFCIWIDSNNSEKLSDHVSLYVFQFVA